MTAWLAKAAAALRPSEERPCESMAGTRMLFTGEHEWRWAMCHPDEPELLIEPDQPQLPLNCP